jgi:hypothetical protein
MVGDYESFNACIEAGLDLWIWRNGGYSAKFRAEVVAWYQLKQSLKAHVADESAPKRKS